MVEQPRLPAAARRGGSMRWSWSALPADPLRQFGGQRRDRDADLLGRVAIAQRHRLVLHRLVIDRHAKGRADLVLAAIAPPDRSGLIVGHREMLLQHRAYLMGLL